MNVNECECYLLYNFFCSTADEPVWVFGMCDTSQQLALGYMEIVNDRIAATLLPIVEDHTHNGTIILAAYSTATNCIESLISQTG